MSQMMKCGCAAQGVRIMKDDSRIPACLIHDCIDPASEAPDLTGRKARCVYYGGSTARRGSYGGGNECNYGQGNAARCTCEQPSSATLPFFEFCGASSRESAKCKCGYYETAHGGSNCKCRKFEPQGDKGFDKFYCGCHGWD